MSGMYPDIGQQPPSAPGFNFDMDSDKQAYQQPPYAPYQPPPPYTGPNYPPPGQMPVGGYGPPPQPQVIVQQPTTNVPSTTTTTVVMDKFPSKSINTKCFYCHQDIKTRTQPRANVCTWLLCSLLCFIGCFCGCCLIPFCTNASRDILHYCPNCHKYLGSHERFRFR